MDRPGYSRFSERAVFDYSDRQEAGRYGDRRLYDSPAETASRSAISRQVVDYNHGSVSATSTDDHSSVTKELDRATPTSGVRDIDRRQLPGFTEPRRSPDRPPADEPISAPDANDDIKFIQDTIVSD